MARKDALLMVTAVDMVIDGQKYPAGSPVNRVAWDGGKIPDAPEGYEFRPDKDEKMLRMVSDDT